MIKYEKYFSLIKYYKYAEKIRIFIIFFIKVFYILKFIFCVCDVGQNKFQNIKHLKKNLI